MNINDLHKNNHDEYIIHIVGSSSYKVRVQITNNGDIIESSCDCPYDFGPICKHEAAVCFLLAEMWKEENTLDWSLLRTSLCI